MRRVHQPETVGADHFGRGVEFQRVGAGSGEGERRDIRIRIVVDMDNPSGWIAQHDRKILEIILQRVVVKPLASSAGKGEGIGLARLGQSAVHDRSEGQGIGGCARRDNANAERVGAGAVSRGNEVGAIAGQSQFEVAVQSGDGEGRITRRINRPCAAGVGGGAIEVQPLPGAPGKAIERNTIGGAARTIHGRIEVDHRRGCLGRVQQTEGGVGGRVGRLAIQAQIISAGHVDGKRTVIRISVLKDQELVVRPVNAQHHTVEIRIQRVIIKALSGRGGESENIRAEG